MEDYDRLRDLAREKLRLAVAATDPQVKRRLAETAFEFAQRAEAMERAAQGHPPAEPDPTKR